MLEGTAWLFCPADRADRFDKAAAAADIVILDLEDGVAPADRPRARENLQHTRLDPARTVVRVSPSGTTDHAQDVSAAGSAGYRTIMLAKAETAGQAASLSGFGVIALCETPLGVLHAESLARTATVEALMWGAEDLIAGIGGRSSRFADGRYRDVPRHARSAVLLAAAAAAKPAIDAVYLDIADLSGLADEAQDAAQSGFTGKACIHPTQAPVVRSAFAPTANQLAWARRLLGAADGGPGVFALDGKMIDEPLLRQARKILSRGDRP